MNSSSEKGRNRRTFSTPTFSPPAFSQSTVSCVTSAPRAHHDDDALGLGVADVVEEVVLPAGDFLRSAPSPPPRAPGRPCRSGCRPRGPGRTRRGSAPCRAASGGRASARASGARRSARSAAAAADPRPRSASILATSCDVRNPSKKCRNGTRDRSVASWAMAAKSCASWTEPEASMANPVCRQAITSEWSPKIDRACVATVRADTCMQNEVSSPAILNMLGIISSRPCDAVNVVVRAPACSAPCTAPGGAALGLHLGDLRNRAPDVLLALGRPLVGPLAHVGGGRDGVDRDDFVGAVGNGGGCLVAVDGDVLPCHVCAISD